MLLNIQWIAEEIKQEKQTNKKLETTENETTTIQTLQDTVEPVPREKFIAIQSYLRKQGNSKPPNLISGWCKNNCVFGP